MTYGPGERRTEPCRGAAAHAAPRWSAGPRAKPTPKARRDTKVLIVDGDVVSGLILRKTVVALGHETVWNPESRLWNPPRSGPTGQSARPREPNPTRAFWRAN
jgi:hypothetical protein